MMVATSRTASIGHRLPNYDGICSSLHGHNAKFEVCIEVVSFIDFKQIDARLGKLTEILDHAMILNYEDPFRKVLQSHDLPKVRVVSLNVDPTTEALAQLGFNWMHEVYPRTQSFTVYETDKYSATCCDSEYGDGKVDKPGGPTRIVGM